MTSLKDNFNGIQEYADDQGLDLGWIDRQGEWGVKASADGAKGLTLNDTQIGSYGDPPDESDNMTGKPRGAAARPNAYRIGGYQVRTKSDIWLTNASMLYEEALQRQWSSATDIPWQAIKPLPDDIERAQCQLATFLTEVEFVAADIPGPVGSEHDAGLLRAADVPDHADHGRVASPGRVPQASSSERWRTDAAPGHQRDHQRSSRKH